MDSLYKSEKIQCQHQAIWFNSFNQIITNTLTGDIMVLFLTDVLLFKTIDITFILSLIPLISIIRLPLIIFTRVKNYTKIIRISVIVKMIFVIFIASSPQHLICYSMYSILSNFPKQPDCFQESPRQSGRFLNPGSLRRWKHLYLTHISEFRTGYHKIPFLPHSYGSLRS